MAAEFGVGKTQINNIVTAKADILKLWDDGVNGRRKLVAARRCPYVELNAKVFDWFCSARSRNIPLTGRLLQAKASERLQPMDAGIIQNMKMVYRKKLLRHILFLMNEARTASDIVKKVTVLDAILWLTTAWDSVFPETIQKCFRKCGFSDAIVDASSDDEWDEEDLRPLLPPGTSLRDYVDSDDHVATQRTIDDNWERVLIDDAKVDTDGEVDSSIVTTAMKAVRKLCRRQLRGRTVRTC